MVEAHVLYDLLPNLDLKGYAAWAHKTVEAVLKAPGLVEFRAHRGLMAPTQVRTTTIWKTMADWASFIEGPWQQMEGELRAYAANLRSELWGPSPMFREPLKPSRQRDLYEAAIYKPALADALKLDSNQTVNHGPVRRVS